MNCHIWMSKNYNSLTIKKNSIEIHLSLIKIPINQCDQPFRNKLSQALQGQNLGLAKAEPVRLSS